MTNDQMIEALSDRNLAVVAKRVGCSAATLRRFVAGETKPLAVTLAALERYLRGDAMELERKLRDMALDVIASEGQACEAYMAQERMEAEIKRMDDALRFIELQPESPPFIRMRAKEARWMK